jgi:hypothetical protein
MSIFAELADKGSSDCIGFLVKMGPFWGASGASGCLVDCWDWSERF